MRIKGNVGSIGKIELMKFEEVSMWPSTVSERSRTRYLSSLIVFCSFAGKDPAQLIRQRDRELRLSDYKERTGIRDMLLEFRTNLEKSGYAPKTINSMDGAVRSLFTAVLGKSAMINIRNYENAHVSIHKDIVPTLGELRKMLEVCNIEDRFRIIFLAQTGIRIGDALSLKLGDIKRELHSGNGPLAILYLPRKDRQIIGERVTFLGSDGKRTLKTYLQWRKFLGEKLTSESPLFASRSRRGQKAVSQQKVNTSIRNAAKMAGIVGRKDIGQVRSHCLRKFFTTQLTDHGVQDKVINHMIGHAIPEIDRVYWNRRIEELRRIYGEKEQYISPFVVKRFSSISNFNEMTTKVRELELKVERLFGVLTGNRLATDASHISVMTSQRTGN